jgi:hypothetical protein
MNSPICERCRSSNVEKRGTREREGEAYYRIKCHACKKWSKFPFTYDVVPTYERSDAEIAEFLDSEIFIITCAQNNTPLDKKAWKGVKHYAKRRNAQIIVIGVLYRNPTSPGELMSEEAWWPPEVAPYLTQQDIELAPHIRVIGDARINATAVNPLTGFESLTSADSAIFGHAQVQMKTIPTPQNKLPKILHTTGSVSQKNYSRSKAGKKADFHHSLGFVIVEVDREEGIFHMRGVVGDNDSEFYDLDYHITPRGVKKIKQIEALDAGDSHGKFMCPDVRQATWTAPDSIVQTLRPKFIIHHDFGDHYSITHHHRNQPSVRFKKHLNGEDRLEDELLWSARELEALTPDFATSVIIPSNHHDHVVRWLEETDWKLEPWNAKIYHQMWAAWIEAIENDKETTFHPFTWWMQQNCKANAMYLIDDYPFLVKGIHLGYHGHKGPNGTRGNINSFAKIGVKTVTAHTHSPGIEKGAYRVGTSSKLRLEYTSGPSSWLNTHCIIHANGKRQLINVIFGDWRYEGRK